MNLVIIESPFASNPIKYTEYGRDCMRDCLLRGEAPFASHLVYTQPGVLNDELADEREMGIEAGLAWGKFADKTVVYTDHGISAGMQIGIDRATAEGREIEYRLLKPIDTGNLPRGMHVL